MFRQKIGNYCFGENVGNFEINSTFSQIYVYGGTLFASTGKTIEPTLKKFFGFFPILGKGWDISSYYVKLGRRGGIGNVARTR